MPIDLRTVYDSEFLRWLAIFAVSTWTWRLLSGVIQLKCRRLTYSVNLYYIKC